MKFLGDLGTGVAEGFGGGWKLAPWAWKMVGCKEHGQVLIARSCENAQHSVVPENYSAGILSLAPKIDTIFLSSCVVSRQSGVEFLQKGKSCMSAGREHKRRTTAPPHQDTQATPRALLCPPDPTGLCSDCMDRLAQQHIFIGCCCYLYFISSYCRKIGITPLQWFEYFYCDAKL